MPLGMLSNFPYVLLRLVLRGGSLASTHSLPNPPDLTTMPGGLFLTVPLFFSLKLLAALLLHVSWSYQSPLILHQDLHCFPWTSPYSSPSKSRPLQHSCEALCPHDLLFRLGKDLYATAPELEPGIEVSWSDTSPYEIGTC